MATTSLPLATAAAVATILSAPANAAPNNEAPVPTTPASPSQDNAAAPQDQNAPQQQPDPNCPDPSVPCTPGENQAPGSPQQQQQQPGTTPQPGTTSPQPGVTTPQPGTTTPQPGVTTPQPDSPQMAGPGQPGVTTPRVAPLPVPGQSNPGAAPEQAVQPDQNGAQPEQLRPGQPPQSQDQGVVTPNRPQPRQQPQGQGNTDSLTGNQGSQQQEQPRWNSPSLQAAPAAPVVAMDGPRTEVGANIDGGPVLPGYVANTRHFSNLDGYVGTIGYRTPTGSGDAGMSVEFVEANKIKLTSYTHATGFDDLKSETYIDTTQANAAKAAVEGWIRQQPGGAAALDAAARIGRLPEGEIAPQTVDVAGVTTQWGGDVRY
ncbi:hypothetical protein [Nocardia transvalensis]|uniref:hypothetical protein n=1 Tax=Nocardia transvalensis TaxID=37333 RepID=UPI001893CB4C|nr:hypothetical protein [Nocardia transvalensis]MBF6334012.1 hypothetical protein [Nocardia transvalensis]